MPLSLPDNASVYSLRLINDDDSDRAPLVTPLTPSYGSTLRSPTRPSARKTIFNATIKMGMLFIVSTLALSAILWFALPSLDECVFCLPKLALELTFSQSRPSALAHPKIF